MKPPVFQTHNALIFILPPLIRIFRLAPLTRFIAHLSPNELLAVTVALAAALILFFARFLCKPTNNFPGGGI